MRGVLVAEEDNFKSYYIESIFNSIWQDGLNMNDEGIIQKVIKNLDVNPKTFLLRIWFFIYKRYLEKKQTMHMKKEFLAHQALFQITKISGVKTELSLL